MKEILLKRLGQMKGKKMRAHGKKFSFKKYFWVNLNDHIRDFYDKQNQKGNIFERKTRNMLFFNSSLIFSLTPVSLTKLLFFQLSPKMFFIKSPE